MKNPLMMSQRELRRTRCEWSGICICGHSADHHHGSGVADPAAVESIGPILYQECEYYGCNECWKQCPKCPRDFIDREDPLCVYKVVAHQAADLEKPKMILPRWIRLTSEGQQKVHAEWHKAYEGKADPAWTWFCDVIDYREGCARSSTFQGWRVRTVRFLLWLANKLV